MNKELWMLELFFEEPSKHWHFEEILKNAKISRPQAALWLKRFAKERLVIRVKQKGNQPYYTANNESPSYRIKKRLFSLIQLEKLGFLSHLAGLPKAQTVILFGSFSRWDWHKGSDIDIFIYGKTEGFDYEKYRYRLHRPLEVFSCDSVEELQRFKPAFLRNVIDGYLVKGTTKFIEGKNAK